MKRILLIVLILNSFGTVSFSQVRVALHGGLHQSTILETNNLPGWDLEKGRHKARTGVHLGFVADIPFYEHAPFFFQPGVIYHNKGRKYQHSQDSTLVYVRPPRPDSVVNTFYSSTREQYLNYIDVPLNLVYKLKIGPKTRFIIGAGPYLSLFYSGSDNRETLVAGISYEQEENKDLPVGKGAGSYATLDYGLNGLAGFEFGRVYISANFSQGLKDFHEPADYTPTNYKHRVFGGSIGVFLGKQAPPAPKDRDGDGVPDSNDKCPDLPGLLAFEGCPDTDGDGVTDGLDDCPGIAGPAENRGCPWPDRDGDGVLDKDDLCPDQPGTEADRGCPPADTDKDGIIDREDKCPLEPGLARYQGCPVPDRDKDGVNDEEDKCPDLPGLPFLFGCPEIKEEVKKEVEYAAKKIQFRVNSAVLTENSYPVLDQVVDLLKANPELKMDIGGHTSAEGPYETNMRLSESRANSVKAYLVSRGISEGRLIATGYGPNKPLNPGRTPAERVENRRVELELSNQ